MNEEGLPPVPEEFGETAEYTDNSGTLLSEEQVSSLLDGIYSSVYGGVHDALAADRAEEANAELMDLPAETGGGEILIPGSEEISVLEVVQSLLSYFREDDNEILSNIRDTVTEIRQEVVSHPAMTTNFEDYTVSEALLLLILLFLVFRSCVRIVKVGFSCLR